MTGKGLENWSSRFRAWQDDSDVVSGDQEEHALVLTRAPPTLSSLVASVCMSRSRQAVRGSEMLTDMFAMIIEARGANHAPAAGRPGVFDWLGA